MVSRNVDVPIIKEFKDGKIYKWCLKCDRAIEIDSACCEAGEEIDKGDFTCEDCTDLDIVSSYISCPGCGIRVVKTSGCNHMTCLCGVHFCYLCGKEFDEEEIYDHINDVHY